MHMLLLCTLEPFNSVSLLLFFISTATPQDCNGVSAYLDGSNVYGEDMNILLDAKKAGNMFGNFIDYFFYLSFT